MTLHIHWPPPRSVQIGGALGTRSEALHGGGAATNLRVKFGELDRDLPGVGAPQKGHFSSASAPRVEFTIRHIEQLHQRRVTGFRRIINYALLFRNWYSLPQRLVKKKYVLCGVVPRVFFLFDSYYPFRIPIPSFLLRRVHKLVTGIRVSQNSIYLITRYPRFKSSYTLPIFLYRYRGIRELT